MERPAKLQRLDDFRTRIPHASQRALLSILREAREGNLPDCSHSRYIRAARDMVALQDTPFGQVIQEFDVVMSRGHSAKIELTNPHAMLYAASRCRKFGALLKNTMDSNPCTIAHPWGITTYSDEAQVGNRMKQDNHRSLQAVYWTFLSFGPEALSTMTSGSSGPS